MCSDLPLSCSPFASAGSDSGPLVVKVVALAARGRNIPALCCSGALETHLDSVGTGPPGIFPWECPLETRRLP